MTIRIYRQMIKYWMRLLTALDNSLIKQAYQIKQTLYFFQEINRVG